MISPTAAPEAEEDVLAFLSAVTLLVNVFFVKRRGTPWWRELQPRIGWAQYRVCPDSMVIC
jgi:hypothetical protein